MKTVFLVDDDELMLELLRRTLDRAGYRARAFDSAVKASEALAFERPDLVISDINMPGMDGFELVDIIAQRTDEIPVIMITGEPTAASEDRARALGVRLMRKPVGDLSPLLDWVHDAIGVERDDLEAARFDFLIGISHELRTPLTALKLAFDALDGASSAGEEDRERLVEIGRRNLDRLARHVDGQLRLLEHSLKGERAVCRPVSLEEAIGDAAEVSRGLNGSRETRVVTDVERLQAVIRHIAGAWSDKGIATRLAVEVDEQVTLRFENHGFPSPQGQMDSCAGEGPTAPLWNPSVDGSPSFEERACDQIVTAAGGRLVVDGGPVRIELPLAAVQPASTR